MRGSVRKHRVLFVDDTAAQRELTRIILEEAGFEVMTAATGQEALRLVRGLRPDLLLLDVVLPDSSGYEICQELKIDIDTLDTVVLLLSGLGRQAKERVAGLEWGADGYLTKPVDPEELVATIHALLRIRYAEERAKTADLQAEEAAARLASILESSDAAIISTDREGRILSWNPAAERLFGYTAAEVLRAPIARIMRDDRGEEWDDVWGRVMAGDQVRGYDSVRAAKDGTAIPVYIKACPIREPHGHIVGVTEIIWRSSLSNDAALPPVPAPAATTPCDR